MNCEVISTGCKSGNAVLLNGSILFDCGVPFSMLEKFYRNLSLVFLTHIHRDHFNSRTLSKLARRRPMLRFVVSGNLLTEIVTVAHVPLEQVVYIPQGGTKVITEYGTGAKIEASPFQLLHDIANVGWLVNITGGDAPGSAMYATDTHHIPICAPGLDLYMLEANYKQDDLNDRIRRKAEEGTFSYEGRVMQTHMSLETAVEWLQENADPYKSRIVFLHQHVGDSLRADELPFGNYKEVSSC